MSENNIEELFDEETFELAAPCDESVINMGWQWDNNTKANESQYSVHKHTGEPAYADNNFAAITVLSWAANNKPYALKTLQRGQRHKPEVQSVYQECYNATGYPNFWFLFCSASNHGQVDWNEVSRNIAWQRDNNADSIGKARTNWFIYRRDKDRSKLLIAMYELLYGQRHKDEVMSLYRAAFRDNMSKLHEALGS